MKYYYGYKSKNKITRLARIYTDHEHNIKNSHIDTYALHIISQLEKQGYRAYIVGGAVRDLLVQKTPKDFDIVTNARPKQIKDMFRRSQIIGKRFQIVLIPITWNNYIEISTFRSDAPSFSDKKTATQYGTIAQDVKRRDFTCNSLYYSPNQKELIDFTHGIVHIKKRKLVPILTHYKDDPVRLLRAIKYSNKIGLDILLRTKIHFFLFRKYLASVSSSRIGDELLKILTSGYSKPIIQDCMEYKLLKYMTPNIYLWNKNNPTHYARTLEDLALCDSQIHKKYSRIRGLQMLIKQYVIFLLSTEQVFLTKKGFSKKRKRIGSQGIKTLMFKIKQWIFPITPPNSELHNALFLILQEEGCSVPPNSSHVSKKRFK